MVLAANALVEISLARKADWYPKTPMEPLEFWLQIAEALPRQTAN